jgi:CheY-like chemotaxis protein
MRADADTSQPMETVMRDPQGQLSAATEAPSGPPIRRKDRTVAKRCLVIDDEVPIRTMLRVLLTAAGHEVFEAADGAAALEVLDGHSVDVVFCDLFMPGMDGLATIRTLREAFPGVRVVAMSGGGSKGLDDLLDAAHRLGAAVKLCKPFTPEQVWSAADEPCSG